jgi:hypothetical protein
MISEARHGAAIGSTGQFKNDVVMGAGRRNGGVRLGARVDAVRSQSGAEIQRAHNSKLNPESGIIVSPRRGDVAVICDEV